MKSTSPIVVTVALFALCWLMADTSEAGLRRGSFGSSGSSGSYGSSGSSGSYGSSGSSGSSSSRNWKREARQARRAYRRASSGSSSRGSSGSSGYTRGSSGSSGQYNSSSYGSHGSSGSSGWSTSSGSYGGTGYYTSQTSAAPRPAIVRSAPATRQPVAQTRQRVPDAAPVPARLQIDLPADAVVYLVGQQMTLSGTQRTYRLPSLPPGQTFAYPVRVEVVRNGRTVSVEFDRQVTSGVTSTVTIVEQSGQLVVRKPAEAELLAVAR